MRRTMRAADLAAALQALPSLDRAALIERWTAFYGKPPPARTSQALLVRAVAYKIQEQVFGGLKASTRRRLDGQTPAVVPREARPGTMLLREWHGVTHQVTVVDGGVLYRGRQHRSLSAVARIITGSRWSGPAFFGLKATAR